MATSSNVLFWFGFFFSRKILSFCPSEIQANLKGEMCYFLSFPEVINVTASEDRFSTYCNIYRVCFYFEVGMEGMGGGKKGDTKEAERRGRERGTMGEKGCSFGGFFFFLLNSDTRKLCVHGCPFSLAEARRQTEILCQLQRKSMKMLFGSPFHHSARMVSFTL